MPSTRTGSGSPSTAVGVGDERPVRGRPRHPWASATSDTERAASPIAAPIWVRNRVVVRARAGTCAIDSVNESRCAVVLPAAPPGLGPPHDDSVLTVGNVTRRGAHPGFDRRGHHPTRRARRRRFVGCGHLHHTSPVDAPLDTLNPYSWQPKQQCRTVRHGPWFPSLRLKCSQLSDFGRPRASSCNDTPYESEITTARLKLKSHV